MQTHGAHTHTTKHTIIHLSVCESLLWVWVCVSECEYVWVSVSACVCLSVCWVCVSESECVVTVLWVCECVWVSVSVSECVRVCESVCECECVWVSIFAGLAGFWHFRICIEHYGSQCVGVNVQIEHKQLYKFIQYRYVIDQVNSMTVLCFVVYHQPFFSMCGDGELLKNFWKICFCG